MAAQDPLTGLTVEVDSGQYTPQSVLLRRRMAEAMMKQGMDTAPIQSHWQGLARMANALLGGYGAYKLGQEEKVETEALRDADRLTTGRSGSTPTPSMSSAVDSTSRATPASERTNNPGAMYPGPSATKFGSTTHEIIGRNKEHKIAVFSSPEDGAAAQFDLLKRNYAGMRMGDAITKWSGGNSSPGYIALVSKATGIAPDTVITPELLASPVGLTLAQAMARQEGGRPSPLTPEQWATAQRRGLGMAGAVPAQPAPAPAVAQAPAAPVEALPQAPAAAPAPAPAVPPPAAAPPVPAAKPSAAELDALTWQSFGNSAAAMQQILDTKRVGSPSYDKIKAAFNARRAELEKQYDPMAIAKLQKAQGDAAEQPAELARKEAEARKSTADARKTELESEKLMTRDEAYARGLDAINKAAGLPERYGKVAFERALGPVAGAEATGQQPPQIHGDPIGYIGSWIAKGGNMLSHLTEGGAAPPEVQAAVGGLQAELGQMIRKANGMSAKEGDSNVELQNFLRMVGQLPTATSTEDYQRRLYTVNQTFARMMGRDVKDIAPFKYPEAQKAPAAKPLQETLDDKFAAPARKLIDIMLRGQQGE